ncbi:MAG: sulfolactate dehydrogenase [Gammaproteobacteria bacterium]|nr:sulfolactate dehydrogenase [Gammaproteobacteria bacterium]
MVTLSSAEAEALATRALTGCGTSLVNAASTARALVAADVDGQSGHGLARLPGYAAQVKAGKIDGLAVPTLTGSRLATLQIDAKGGFAYPALDVAIDALPGLALAAGVAAAGIFASHHIGQAGRTVERLANQGLVALVVSNTPSAMALPGGTRPMMGTNPLAFAAPVGGRAPLVIDLALSLVARSKIVAAQKAGQSIPPDWASDPAGKPTTDPAAALIGALAPIGGAKGAALAFMVEILCGALAGGHYGWEASSFLDDRGSSPGVGQVLIVFDPAAFGGPGFSVRMDSLLAAVAAESAVRLPGDRRLASRERARVSGVSIPSDLHAQIKRLAAGGVSP